MMLARLEILLTRQLTCELANDDEGDEGTCSGD